MRATKRETMPINKFLPRTMKAARRVFIARHSALTLLLFFGLNLLFACSFGCAPSSSSGGDSQISPSSSSDIPDITEEMILERINGTRVRKVPEENGTAEPLSWTFNDGEPKEISVVEKQVEGTRATLLLDIKTRSFPGAREPRFLAGQIRTEWILETGWVLRRWEIVKAENVSMKYKNLPKPPADNSDR